MFRDSTNNTSVAAAARNNKPLEQKLLGALQTLRRERDQEYRDKAEAEQRLRLAEEEQQAIAKIVADLKGQHEKLVKDQATVEASLGPLEAQVDDLTKKVKFQHNELIASRAKIHQKEIDMKETAVKRQEKLEAIRQVAHQRRLKFNAMEKQNEQQNKAKLEHFRISGDKKKNADDSSALELGKKKERLERELNCMLFQWESLPKLMEEKAEMYLAQARQVAKVNEDLIRELRRQGISFSEMDSPQEAVAMDTSTTPNVSSVGAA